MYITYFDGRHGYEAYAQLQNHTLENYDDLTLQIRVDNEKNFTKLIEQEVFDVLVSLNYVKDYAQNFSQVSFDNDQDVQVAE